MSAASAKISRRILPFVCLLFIFSFLDRVNVSYAALDMMRDLGLSATAYGFGAGLFFLTYLVFEVPAAILVERRGARVWLARMMIAWGITSTLMAAVRNAGEFYVLRAALGISEAGFFPGIILYLGHWFSKANRARAIGALAVGLPLANLFGALLSGWLLKQRWLEIPGWRWMFIVEGLPSVIGGLAALHYLTERPSEAGWLSLEEREWMQAELEAERSQSQSRARVGVKSILQNRNLKILVSIWFLDNVGLYGFNFWLPMIIKRLSGLPSATVVTIASIPFAGAVLSALFVSLSSDRRAERRLHTALPMAIFGAGLIGSLIVSEDPLWALGMLSISALGLTSGTPGFWALAAESNVTSNSVYVALITSFGALGGFCGPYLMGAMQAATHDFSTGLLILGCATVTAAVLVFRVQPDRRGGSLDQV